MADDKKKAKLIDDVTQRATKSFDKAEDLNITLKEQYLLSLEDIQKTVSDFYTKYASENGLSYTAAVTKLSKIEMKAIGSKLKQYMKQLDEDNLELKVLIETLSKKARISRFECLMASIRFEIAKLAGVERNSLTDHLTGVFSEHYSGAASEIIGSFKANVLFGKVNPDLIKETIQYPWSGQSFSEIIWNDTNKLVTELKSELTQGFIKGTSVQKMSSNLAKRMDNKYKNALRLVRTETAHVLNKAALMSYEACGVKYVEFLAVLDGKTSEVCLSLNGDIIPISEAIPGVNIPPLHPNCRSTIIPVIDEDIANPGNSDKIEVGTKLNEFETVIESPKQKIFQVSKHAAQQLTERNLRVQDAQRYVNNAVASILQSKTRTVKYISSEGTTILNAEGKLVTAYGANLFDENELDLLRRLKG
jgi:SPP1 gp7 family putative phage head morphogenesis protein